MSDLTRLSKHQLNKMVAEKKGLDFQNVELTRMPPIPQIWVNGKSYSPCDNWSECGPLIIDSGIEMK